MAMPQNTSSTSSAPQQTPSSAQDQLFEKISGLVAPAGFECVQIEIVNQRQKVLRVFIDRTDGKAVGIEDCVSVTRLLDEPLEASAEINEVFRGGAYELEVSSPGVDRPLRRAQDFQRFAGREARIHTFRPLNALEAGNEAYIAKNPRQKNFLGVIEGVHEKKTEEPGTVRIMLQIGADHVGIPLRLIAKANLEPKFDFDKSEDRSTEE
jgi:ribosome maturation factor RimP